MKATFRGLKLIAVISTLMAWLPAHASLIGQSVDLALVSVEDGNSPPVFIASDVLTNPLNVVVVENDIEGDGFMDGFMDVNIEAETLGMLMPGGVVVNGIATSLNDALGIGPQEFIGLLFANLSWGPDNPGSVIGVTNLQTNIAGFSESNVLFDATNVAFNIVDLAIDAGSFVIVDLVVEHNSRQIPEPGILALFGLALVGMRFSKKK